MKPISYNISRKENHFVWTDEQGQPIQTVSGLPDCTPEAAIAVIGWGGRVSTEGRPTEFPETERLAIRFAQQFVPFVLRQKISLLDGGTYPYGMMTILRNVFAELCEWPPAYIGVCPAKAAGTKVDSRSSHTLLLQPGEIFGDESELLVGPALSLVAGGKPCAVILFNGGMVTRKDLYYSCDYRRHVFVVKGSGRLADIVAAELELPASSGDTEIEQLVAAHRDRLHTLDVFAPDCGLHQVESYLCQ